MSRYTIKTGKNKEFVYGFDHALGYFYQLWDYNMGIEDEECLIKDKSQLLEHLPKEELLILMEEYGAAKEHLYALSLDLPF